MNKILKRLITGIIYVAVIVIPLIIDSSRPFGLVFAAFTILALAEFRKLFAPHTDAAKADARYTVNDYLDLLGGVFVFLSARLYYVKPGFSAFVMLPAIAYFIIRIITQLYIKSENPIKDMALSIFGIAYISVPLALLNTIYFEHSPGILLMMFIFIWLNDTGAYCFGCTLGKHRLFERISPKKSWEGFFGGLGVCIAASFLFWHYNDTFDLGMPNLASWIGLGIVVSVFATWGDLCESLIKRTLNVKDSGNLLPGHGGILDRIDSLLVVSPVVVIYLSVINLIFY